MTIVCLEANYLLLEAALRLVLMSFLSLDGVYQGPGAPDEDQSDGFDRGGWLVPFADARFEKIADEWTATATGFLFGRRTYEAFSVRLADDRRPDRFERGAAQRPSQVRRHQEPDRYVVGSRHRHRRRSGSTTDVDETPRGRGTSDPRKWNARAVTARHGPRRRVAHRHCAPVVVGQGHKLFGDTGISIGFELLSQDQTPSGLTMTRFAYTGDAATGEYKRGETNVAS